MFSAVEFNAAQAMNERQWSAADTRNDSASRNRITTLHRGNGRLPIFLARVFFMHSALAIQVPATGLPGTQFALLLDQRQDQAKGS